MVSLACCFSDRNCPSIVCWYNFSTRRQSYYLHSGLVAYDRPQLTCFLLNGLIYCAGNVFYHISKFVPNYGNMNVDYERFYRAMLCIRGTSHGPVSFCVCVCVCVRLSQAGVLLKRQNVVSHKQHQTIPQGLVF